MKGRPQGPPRQATVKTPAPTTSKTEPALQDIKEILGQGSETPKPTVGDSHEQILAGLKTAAPEPSTPGSVSSTTTIIDLEEENSGNDTLSVDEVPTNLCESHYFLCSFCTLTSLLIQMLGVSWCA